MMGRVMLARHHPDDATTDRRMPVHMLPLPLAEHCHDNGAIAYCGALLPVDRIEAVDPARNGGQDWCVMCFTAHTTGAPPAPVPGTAPFSTPTPDGRHEALATYGSWGWPITLRRAQIWLDLEPTHAVGVVVKVITATAVTDLLARRGCAPAVLAHPMLPSHRIILAGDRLPIPLPWPPGVFPLTSQVPLPPTFLTQGPVLWTRPPRSESLTRCREIDVLAALHIRASWRHEPARTRTRRRRLRAGLGDVELGDDGPVV